MTFAEQLGKKLQMLRKKAKLSQNEVAEYFKWKSGQYVSNIERGKMDPSRKALEGMKVLYKMLCVDFEELKRLWMHSKWERAGE